MGSSRPSVDEFQVSHRWVEREVEKVLHLFSASPFESHHACDSH